jgi:methylenetetrahydrofolate dehydrogenase (NADP+)/methenyltetrahydrofolate cyclohydrolase
MTPIIMDGKALFTDVKKQIAREVRSLEEEGYTPGLAVILTSDDPVDLATSQLFVSKKEEDCKEVHIYFEKHEIYKIREQDREKSLARLISRLNNRDDISGIIIQKPLADCLHEDKILTQIDWSKDVDGLTPCNKGRLMNGYDIKTNLLPCTAVGIVELLSHYGVENSGKEVIIIGRSDLVGRPLRVLLEQEDATVTCLHRKSPDKKGKILNADIVVCAAGRPPELFQTDSFRLTGDMIKEGAVIVGVGMKKDPVSGKLYFDVDFDSVSVKASFVTPNLGSVGLMTRARLLQNLIIASRLQAKRVQP